MEKVLCISVDLDRDVNDAIPGSVAAISLDRGSGNSPRFSSTAKGTELIVEMLDDLGMKATFFAEARALHKSGAFNFVHGHEIALHGLDHEDFTGSKSGIILDEGEMREIIASAISLIRDCVGYQPKGFRTPYMDVRDELIGFLPEYGIQYDSSYYRYMDETLFPYELENGIIEIPVPKGTDANGKNLTSYLWPMHEGTRTPQDFYDFADTLKDGVFTLATHTWHICESRKNGVMDAPDLKKNIDNLRTLLENIQDNGFRIRTMSEVAKDF